jgi:hypothetical protein
MKLRLLGAALLIITAPQATRAWDGVITLSPSPFPDACVISEPEGGGVMEVYVVYDGRLWIISAGGFRVRSGEGFTGVYLGETVDGGLLTLGNTQDGLAMSGINQDGPVLLATIRYMTDGTSAPCSHLEVVEHPEYGSIWVTDLDKVYSLPDPGPLLVNVPWPDDSCVWCVSPNPVETTTWGGVKALYTE